MKKAIWIGLSFVFAIFGCNKIGGGLDEHNIYNKDSLEVLLKSRIKQVKSYVVGEIDTQIINYTYRNDSTRIWSPQEDTAMKMLTLVLNDYKKVIKLGLNGNVIKTYEWVNGNLVKEINLNDSSIWECIYDITKINTTRFGKNDEYILSKNVRISAIYYNPKNIKPIIIKYSHVYDLAGRIIKEVSEDSGLIKIKEFKYL